MFFLKKLGHKVIQIHISHLAPPGQEKVIWESHMTFFVYTDTHLHSLVPDGHHRRTALPPRCITPER